MKKTLLVLFACVAAAGFAQSNYQDVVFLKNGGRVKGVIIEQVPYQSLKIATNDGNILVYQMDEVEKTSKEAISETKEKNNFKSHYKGIVDLGYNIGVGAYGLGRFSLNVINGWQINPNFYAGVGIGLRYFPEVGIGVKTGQDMLLFPYFFDIRVDFWDSAISPYLSLDIGYSACNIGFFIDDDAGGFMLNPTIGVNVEISNNASFNIGVGYEMQKLDFVNFYDGNLTSVNFGAIAIKLGFAF